MIIPLSFFIQFIVPSVLKYRLMFDYDRLHLHINDAETFFLNTSFIFMVRSNRYL